jgi:hypothetical protein
MKTLFCGVLLALALGCASDGDHSTSSRLPPDVGQTGIGGGGAGGTGTPGAGMSNVGVDRQRTTGTGALTNRAGATPPLENP